MLIEFLPDCQTLKGISKAHSNCTDCARLVWEDRGKNKYAHPVVINSLKSLSLEVMLVSR